MAKSLTTICRTLAITAVWVSSSIFLTAGLPEYRISSSEAMEFYVIAIAATLFAAVAATAVLWLFGRRHRSPDVRRAFEVVPTQRPD